jgi:hypothetical protein
MNTNIKFNGNKAHEYILNTVAAAIKQGILPDVRQVTVKKYITANDIGCKEGATEILVVPRTPSDRPPQLLESQPFYCWVWDSAITNTDDVFDNLTVKPLMPKI